jgi:hypothetical protein
MCNYRSVTQPGSKIQSEVVWLGHVQLFVTELDPAKNGE